MMQSVEPHKENHKMANPQELINKLRETLETVSKRKLTFLLVGRTGVGKSSTVNTLIGKQVAETGDWEPTTFEVKFFESEIDGIQFELIDTPGLCDDFAALGNDDRYLKLIKEKTKEIDCMWFVSKLSETRVTADEKRGIKLISEFLGHQIWNHAIIVFTFANSVTSEKYSEALFMRTKLIRQEIANYAGEDIAINVPSVAVDNSSQTTPDGEEWLGELYSKVCNRISDRGSISFLLATKKRVTYSSKKKSKVNCPSKSTSKSNSDNQAGYYNSQSTDNYSQPINLNEYQKGQVKERIDKSMMATFGVTGASIGAVFSPVGAVIGGVLGAAIGFFASFWD